MGVLWPAVSVILIKKDRPPHETVIIFKSSKQFSAPPQLNIDFYIESINSWAAGVGSVTGSQRNSYKKKCCPPHETVIIIKSGVWFPRPPHLIRVIIRGVRYENGNLVEFHENKGVELHSRRHPDWL